jgi:hypothetical protein
MAAYSEIIGNPIPAMTSTDLRRISQWSWSATNNLKYFRPESSDIEINAASVCSGVIVKSGVWAFSSSGDLISFRDFDTVSEFGWTCPGLVPVTCLIYAAALSNARGLLPPNVECLRRGL